MAGIRKNALSQALDIAGSVLLEDTLSRVFEGVIGRVLDSGADGTITAATKNFNSPTAAFVASDIGQFIRISGAVNPGNDGEWLITAVVDGNNVTLGQGTTFVNEGPGLDWEQARAYSLEDDLNYIRGDRKRIKGTGTYADAIPTYQRPSAIGTDVDASLTNLAGMTLDAKTEVRNVRETAVKMRPSITAADGNTAAADETFTTDDYHFFADDVGSFITISGSAQGANGTYRISTVTDGQTVELVGLNAAGAEAGLTWVLEGAQKAILSSRSHADAVDRRGIPIADVGAYDQTRYDATFADIVDSVGFAGFTSYAGDAVWARQYGDDLAPAETSEGVFFVVQFKTGANDAGASTRSWEVEAGRSGADGGVTAASKTFTSATAAFTQDDVGKWLAIWGCGADGNPGIFQIASVTSATTCTVTKAANFVADPNTGSLNWHITRYPHDIEVYFGDRYRLDELSETAHRTTLIGGVVSDAELAEDIREIRAAIGIVDGDEDLAGKLTNLGNFYIFQGLSGNPTVVEALNELNEQVGDRDYAGAILVDGETITASLQRLADAISGSSPIRTIERLAANIPAGTTHDLPAAAGSYKVDASDNGLYMWVFWRGILRDPGLLVNNDDYDETSGAGGGGGVGQITPYTLINQNDHISYIILNAGP